MAGEDEKGKEKAQAGAGGPSEARPARSAEGAVHGPGARALRLRVEQAAPAPAGEGGGGRRAAGGPGRPAGDQRRPHRRRGPGPGADRGDAPHPGPALPRGVRHLDGVQPEARRQHPQAVQARGRTATRTTARCSTRRRSSTRSSSPRPTSGTRSTRSTASRPASTSTARRRCRTRSRARAAWCWPPRETGKLLQIGHQRRSNPRYIHCYEKLLGEAKLLGRIVTVNGQWNRAVAPDLGAPDRYAIPDGAAEAVPASRTCTSSATGAGTRASAAGRSWISARTRSTSTAGSSAPTPPHVMASGGLLYHDPKTHEWYDTVMVVYDYDTPLGPAKAYYQTQTTNGSQGYFETFMGDQGTLLISESEVNYAGQLYRDPNAPAWDEWIQKGYVSAPKEQEAKEKSDSGAVADVRESVAPDQHTVPVVAARPLPPAAPAELLRRRARQGQAQLPGRGRLRERGQRPQGQRGDRGEVPAVVQARRLQDLEER